MTESLLTPAGADVLLAQEQVKIRKLQILFGLWWQHYAVPYEFRWTLYLEHTACPYCGEPLGPISTEFSDAEDAGQTAHLDHMDPVSRGGEDSLRNAVYVCAECNRAKRNRLFVDWIKTLAPAHQLRTHELYVSKHGHSPEDFKPGCKQARLTLPRLELGLPESVLRRLFPRPIVSGPPRTDAAKR